MAKSEKKEAVYEKPNSQVDLESRQETGNRSGLEVSTFREEDREDDGNARKFALEDNELDNFIGVDPIYQNYASDHLKPGRAEDGPEKDLEDQAYGYEEVLKESGNAPDAEGNAPKPAPAPKNETK